MIEVTLPPHEAHVWLIEVDQISIDDWRAVLAPDESLKADRFRFPADRIRYLAAHISLRQILSRYLQIDLARIQYRANAYGKPFVADRPIEFNLSHSGSVILIAVTRDRAVGIDVEHIRSDFDHQPIVDRFWAAAEKSLLASWPPNVQAEKFFEMWTRTEAVLKMIGQGLSGLDQVASAGVNESQWTVQAVEAGAEYAAALAIEGEAVTVRNFRM